MSIFSDNIITPSPLEQLGKDIKQSFDIQMNIESSRCSMYKLGDIMSTTAEFMLQSIVTRYYGERLKNCNISSWNVNVIKKTAGFTHVTYIIIFDIFPQSGGLIRLFQYEYIWR